MGITAYSLAISIVFYNLALIVVFILRRSPGFRARHAVSLLAFITVLGVVRLVLPIDFDAAYVVRSYKIIPVVEVFLGRPLAGPFTYGHLLLTLWAVGSFVMVIKDVHLQWRFDRYLQSIDFIDRPELLEIAAEYGSGFAVLISPQINMPFTSGILHPIIYLPDVELSDEEWRMVLRHEITHIRSQDNLKKLFFLLLEALFWWNPVAHFSQDEINTLIELKCDIKVVAQMDAQGQAGYLHTLRTLMVYNSQNKTLANTSSLIGTEKVMKLRFQSLLATETYYGKHLRYVLALFLSLMFIGSYFLIVQPIWFPSEIEMTEYLEGHTASKVSSSIDVENDTMYIFYIDGDYKWFINGRYIASLQEEEIASNTDFSTIPIIRGEYDNEKNSMYAH